MDADIQIQFVLLRSLLFFSFAIIGYQINKNSNTKKLFIFSVILYTLIEGLRYNRGIDYVIYKDRYTYIDSLSIWNSIEDPMFIYFCQFLKKMGLGFQSFILICSSLVAIASIKILSTERKIMLYSMPLMVSFMFTAENLIRWYLAYSILLIGLYYLLKEKQKIFYLLSTIAVLMHAGFILYIPIVFLVFYFNKLILPPRISTLIYISIWIFFSTSFMLKFAEYLSFFSLFGERYVAYVDNIDVWLTGSNRNVTSIGLSSAIRYLFPLFITYNYIKESSNKKLIFFYNMYTIGVVSYPMTVIELVNRYNQCFIFFEVFIGSLALYIIFNLKQKSLPKILLALYYCYTILAVNFKKPFEVESDTLLFIWDAVTPVQFFLN